MTGCSIHFKGVLWEIIPKLSLLPLLSGALWHLFISVSRMSDVYFCASITNQKLIIRCLCQLIIIFGFFS